MSLLLVKCRKCRFLLFRHHDITLLNAHSVSTSLLSVQQSNCKTIQEDNLWFLQESNLPIWISNCIDEATWTKGKLNCPNCKARLGSFDFISGNKCECEQYVLPSIHIAKCKVDCKSETNLF